jgi:thiol:disulfide interchange protein DsbC
MLKKLLIAAALMSIGTMSIAVMAVAGDTAEKTVRDAFTSLLPNAKIDRVVKSEVPGFYEVIVGGGVVYVSADGKYLMQGNLYDVPGKKSLTEARLAGIRADALRSLPANKMMTFAPEHPKHTVTVFTDVDCPYCRQFHKQIAAYNAVGIGVNYVLFPLDIHPGADKKAQAVWCAKDRNAAYTAAMNGQDPGTSTCSNPVAETKALSIAIGIDSTPTVLAEDGTHVNGNVVMNPNQLMAELDRLAAKSGSVASAK